MVSNPFASSTETVVYAQRSVLNQGAFLNPIQVIYSPDVIVTDYIEPLTLEAIPNSYAGKVNKLVGSMKANPSIHPYGLPVLNVPRTSITIVEEALPMFWLRNQNIDIDSCWWNIFTEKGTKNNNKATDYNDKYWHRDLKDPDIDRVPDETFTLLSERPETVNLTAEEAVPYELVYPEWFKAHPEYIATNKILKEFGLDVKTNLLDTVRESDDNKEIDHLFFGFFTTLIPSSKNDSEYTFRFFKYLFKDRAFAAPLIKQTSPCVQYALETEGFKTYTAEDFSFINDVGTTLTEKKNSNYFYEYKASDDPEIDLTKIFEYVDPRDETSIELQAQDIIIRKVIGKIASRKQYEVVIGKGALFPEFTNFGEVVYPTNPTIPVTHSDAELDAYAVKVLDPHTELFQEIDGLQALEPPAYISIKVQKFARNNNKHAWDIETATTLNSAANVDYYEEIIIINPRCEYRGIYNTAFKTPRAYKSFHSGDYWTTADKPEIYKYNPSSNVYVNVLIGSRFDGVTGDTDSLTIPVIRKVLNQLVLKEREEVLNKSLSIITISIKRTKVSFLEKNLGTIIQIVFIVVGVITINPSLIKEGITLTNIALWARVLATAYIQSIAFGIASDIVIGFLVNQFGLEDAGIIAALVIIVSTIYGFSENPEYFNSKAFKLSSNFDDSFVEFSQEEFARDLEKFEATRKENIRKLEDMDEQFEYLLADKDPNISLQTRLFQFTNESPQAFYDRTIGNLNPGIGVYEALATQIDRFKWITHTELPKIAVDEQSDDDYINNLV